MEQDSIVFKIERENPIPLDRLTFGMMALGAEYERFIRREHPKSEQSEADLLVQRITEKCIWIELIGAISPIFQGMNNVLVFNQFVELVASKLERLSAPNGRVDEATPKELDNLSRLAQTIAGDPNADAELIAFEHTKDGNGKAHSRFVFRAKEAEQAINNAREQIKEITGVDPNRLHGVIMRLYQTNIGEAQPDRSSGEKGIIEAIDEKPRRLVYASDLAGQRIKSAWQSEGQSPYELAFVVDVDVQTVNGRPRAYRIMNVHDIFPLNEEEE